MFVPPASQTAVHQGGCTRTLLQWLPTPPDERKRGRSEDGDQRGVSEELLPDENVEIPQSSSVERQVVYHELAEDTSNSSSIVLATEPCSGHNKKNSDQDSEEKINPAVAKPEVFVVSDDGDERPRRMFGSKKQSRPTQNQSHVPMTVRRMRKEQSDTGLTLPTSPTPENVFDALNEEQRAAVRLVRRGRSVFITGGAGTGKSFLLRAIISELDPKNTYVTASTGIAALTLGGTTVHSFAGVGLGKESARDLLDRVRGSERSRNSWQACRALIIDEVSMLAGDFLDKLEYIARHIRRSDEPFGGIQLIFCGDFLQLAPIGNAVKGVRVEPLFAFQSRAWRAANPKVCLLKQVFRQANQTLVAALNEMRMGEMSRDTLAMLTAQSSRTNVRFLQHRHDADDEAELDTVVDAHGKSIRGRFAGRSVIRSRNEDVERINQHEFGKLSTDIVTFVEYCTGNPTHVKALQDNSPVPARLELRVGCRVMLCKNIDVSQGLVNGSIGVVTSFVKVDVVEDFENPRAVEMCRLVAPRTKVLPVARFPVRRFNRGTMREEVVELDLIVEPQEWTVTSGSTELAKRTHIPLRLAWAITVHKSQGMTLTSVNVDFANMFAAGQAYVALSRCTSLEGMTLENFSASAVITSPIAVSYYRAVEACLAAEDDDTSNTFMNPWGNDDPSQVPDQAEESADLLAEPRMPTAATVLKRLADGGGCDEVPVATDSTSASTSDNLSLVIESLRRRIVSSIHRDRCAVPPSVAADYDVRLISERRIIFDTCSLIYLVRIESVCLDDLVEQNIVYIPQIVLTELDSQLKNHQLPDLQRSARNVRNLLSDLIKEGRVCFQQPGQENDEVLGPTSLTRDNDGKILSFASFLQREQGNLPVCVCTEDRLLGLRCKSIGIPVCCFTSLSFSSHQSTAN